MKEIVIFLIVLLVFIALQVSISLYVSTTKHYISKLFKNKYIATFYSIIITFTVFNATMYTIIYTVIKTLY